MPKHILCRLALEFLLLIPVVSLSCEPGEYSNNTTCVECEKGKYAPQSLDGSCLDCDAGKYATSSKSTTCTLCPTGWNSVSGATRCKLAAKGYYLTDTDVGRSALQCPQHATCAGDHFLPVPHDGYWVDRSDEVFVGNVLRCMRDTCLVGNDTSKCWQFQYYNESNHNEECNSEELQCTEGAWGPLCGSCMSDYMFWGVLNKCVKCGRTVGFHVSVLFITTGILIVLFFFRSLISSIKFTKKFKKKLSPFRVFSFVDSGSLKFPRSFRAMLSILSYFSLDFLNFECGYKDESTHQAYFNSVYLYCCIPLIFCLLVVASGLVRYLVIVMHRKAPELPAPVSNSSLDTKGLMAQDKQKNSQGEEGESKKTDGTSENNEFQVPTPSEMDNTIDDMMRPLRDSIIVANQKKIADNDRDNSTVKERMLLKSILNQHCWVLTFIMFVVLPPVSNKLFQSYDCIEVNNFNVLRSNTMVDCSSNAYIHFRIYISLLLVIYQSIPMAWLGVLFYKREALNPSILTLDKQLAVYIRDHSSSVAPLRFLFCDYKCDKWWFEVVEMYRRIVFIAVIPLVSTNITTRASLCIVLAIFSIGLFREQEPFGVKFTNYVGYIAQYSILITYYFALTIDNQYMMDFGLHGGEGLGLFLVIVNLLVVVLSFWYGWRCYKEHMKKKEDKENMATQNEDARGFSEVKFKTTFEALWVKSIPSSYALVFYYTNLEDAKQCKKSGLRAEKKFNGVPFTLRQPHSTTIADFEVFGEGNQTHVDALIQQATEVFPKEGGSGVSEVPAPRTFPNQIVFVLSLQQQFLEPLPGYEQDDGLCMISADVLHAMRPTSFTAVLDEKPWIHGIALLPPENILRSYLIMRKEGQSKKESEESEDEDEDEEEDGVSRVPELVDDNLVMDVSLLDHHRLPTDRVFHINSSMDYVQAMTFIRQRAIELDILPLYHYTSPSIAPLILKGGLRMSSQGQGDGGVYVSTLGPALYGLGTDQFEINIIKDCFGVERIEEYKGKGKLDVVIVYGCCGKVLEQTPGGRDNARMFSKSTFATFSLENKTGNYFLRPDRILGAFQFDHSKPFPLTSDSLNEIRFEYKREIEVIAKVKRAQSKLKQNSSSIGATLTKIWKKQHVGLGKTVVGLGKTATGIGETVVGLGESIAVLGEAVALNVGQSVVGLGDQEIMRSISKTISGDLFNGEGGLVNFGRKVASLNNLHQQSNTTNQGKGKVDLSGERNPEEKAKEDEEDDDQSKTSLDIKVEIELNEMKRVQSREDIRGSTDSTVSDVNSPSSQSSSLGSRKPARKPVRKGTTHRRSPHVPSKKETPGALNMRNAVSPASWRRALTTSLDSIPKGTPIPAASPTS